MTYIQIILLFAATLLHGSLCGQSTHTLKIMSYNILDGYDHGKDTEREQKAAKFIQAQKPDVVALQELVGFTPQMLREFAQSYGHNYTAILKEKGYPVGLTSNQPIKVKTKMLDSLWHGMLHASTHDIDFFVVHLSPFDVEIRQREARIITTYMKKTLNSDAEYIVLGDFNSHSPFDAQMDDQRPQLLEKTRASDSKKEKYNNLLDNHFDYSVISRFLSYPLIDVTRRYVPEENRFSFPTPILVGTWLKADEVVPTRRRIDYILTSRNLARKASSAQIINHGVVDELSDHFPVVAEFSNPIPSDSISFDFHGFQGYDFTFRGRKAKIVAPKMAAKGHPWVWRARFWGHEPQTDIALLKKGFHIAYCDVSELYGNEEALSIWNDFYNYLTHSGLSKKSVMEGMSRGGVYIYRWAATYPGRVSAIYADAPVLDLKSWPGGKGKSKGSEESWATFKKDFNFHTESEAIAFQGNPLDLTDQIAQGGFPMLHVVGDSDEVVPVEENTAPFIQKIREAGGSIQVIHKPGIGHHPHSLENPQPIVDFILAAYNF